MRTARTAVVVLIAALLCGQRTSAESLTFALLERYLDALRVQAGIPGLSVAVVQNGVPVWETGLGRANVEAVVAASADTPYPIGEVSQVLGATLLLKRCVDESYLEVRDRVVRWAPEYPEPLTTVAQLLTHTTPADTFHYDPPRFAALEQVIESCSQEVYPRLLAEELFERLAMRDSVPGSALASPRAADAEIFAPARLVRYAEVIRRMAIPYRVDSHGRPSRSDYAPRRVDAANGIVASARDLARFDAALSSGVLVNAATLNAAWTRASVRGAVLPTGLGWFVQTYKDEPLVWQFGMVKDAYSSLILKLPNRNLTLILLANSDGLSSPYALDNGDVTTSVFAKTFLRLLGI